MPRRKTNLINGNVYHLVNRGLLKYPIFKCERDYHVFMDFFKRYSKGVFIGAYALIPNHFHFIVKQLGDGGARFFISNVQREYALYFNREYKRKGPLYEGRFFVERIRDEKHLQNVLKYIFNNPVKHKMVNLGKDGISGINFME